MYREYEPFLQLLSKIANAVGFPEKRPPTRCGARYDPVTVCRVPSSPRCIRPCASAKYVCKHGPVVDLANYMQDSAVSDDSGRRCTVDVSTDFRRSYKYCCIFLLPSQYSVKQHFSLIRSYYSCIRSYTELLRLSPHTHHGYLSCRLQCIPSSSCSHSISSHQIRPLRLGLKQQHRCGGRRSAFQVPALS